MLTIGLRKVSICLRMWFNLLHTHVFLVSVLESTHLTTQPLKYRCPFYWCIRYVYLKRSGGGLWSFSMHLIPLYISRIKYSQQNKLQPPKFLLLCSIFVCKRCLKCNLAIVKFTLEQSNTLGRYLKGNNLQTQSNPPPPSPPPNIK